jgi:LPS O-antigen subunit length determinant protein (WzzB/FepE family)
MVQESKSNVVSIKEIVHILKKLSSFYWEKKLAILMFGLGGLFLGIAAHFIYKPKYTATLCFALQETEQSGGISSLASQFGINLGSGGSGAFGGDNIYELFYSRNIIEKVLLKPQIIENKKDILLNLFLRTYGIDKKIKNSQKPEINKIKFIPGQSQFTFTRQQDSIVKIVYESIIKNMLVANKRSKKLSIGDITFISENEMLSKLFTEGLIKETSDFYIETKTKLSRTNYNLLKQQTDSVKREYDSALQARANLADLNLNSVRQVGGVALTKRQTDIQVSVGAYIEMKKNMEMLKYSLTKETPVIQIIDSPILPLEKKKIGLVKGIVLGGIIGELIGLMYLLIMFYIKLSEKQTT